MDSETPDQMPELPEGASGARTLRFILNAASGAIPLAGGVLLAGAGAWSEREQERINDFLKHWLEMLLAEMKEKRQNILEITARLDMHGERSRSVSRAADTRRCCERPSEIGPASRARKSANWCATYCQMPRAPRSSVTM